MESLTVPAKIDYLDETADFIEANLQALSCPDKIQLQIRLAVEELFVNIASYAYEGSAHPEEGKAVLTFTHLENPSRVQISFADEGVPFNPLDKEDSDTSEEAIMARAGGMGILLVKNMMDDVEYAYRDGQNILTVTKNLTGGEDA